MKLGEDHTEPSLDDIRGQGNENQQIPEADP